MPRAATAQVNTFVSSPPGEMKAFEGQTPLPYSRLGCSGPQAGFQPEFLVLDPLLHRTGSPTLEGTKSYSTVCAQKAHLVSALWMFDEDTAALAKIIACPWQG